MRIIVKVNGRQTALAIGGALLSRLEGHSLRVLVGNWRHFVHRNLRLVSAEWERQLKDLQTTIGDQNKQKDESQATEQVLRIGLLQGQLADAERGEWKMSRRGGHKLCFT